MERKAFAWRTSTNKTISFILGFESVRAILNFEMRFWRGKIIPERLKGLSEVGLRSH